MPAPKRNASVSDIALRLIIKDLVERYQARLPDIAKVLGYEDSTVISKFLKGERNYPVKKVSIAINTFVKIYNANRVFLKTGHGEMYLNNPYMNEEKIINKPANITTLASDQKINELTEINRKLQEKNKQLEKLLKAKDQIIKLQEKIINKSV